MKKRSKALAIIGILVFALTILLFFTATEQRVTITWTGFVFILIVEIIFFGGLILIERLTNSVSPIIIRGGAGITLIACSILSILTSILFMSIARGSVKTLIAIQAILAAMLAIVFVVSYISAHSVKESNDKVLNATSTINSLIGKMNLLKVDQKNEAYSVMINKVAEELRYSDISTIVPSDYELEKNIAKLEIALIKEDERNEQEIKKIIEAMLININRRKVEVRNSKNGGI